ncbi:MAG: chemotaxis protein CheW [Candidatus Brocadiae bacterium]|nr:chemotaxis protein CheW [Candidatus Brocadiia bacterium]
MDTEDEKYLQVVTFMLGEEEFAFEISHVKEVIRLPVMTKVPKAKDFIEGVINLRGNVIPIIDLRKRFHFESHFDPRTTRIIILEIESIMVGGIVDAVLETKTLESSCIEPPPTAVMGGMESEYIYGVAKLEDRLISLLNIDKLLDFDRPTLKDR